MNNKIIFLRHAETEKNPLVNAALWGISEKGKVESREIASLEIMRNVDVIYVSEEQKTYLTAEPIIKRVGVTPTQRAAFNEVMRGDKFLSKEDFEKEKIKQLENLDYPAFDGETGVDALSRFTKGVSIALKENQNKNILIVTHGTILNIYFAKILDKQNELPERWRKTNFCAIGIIMDGKVIKDII